MPITAPSLAQVIATHQREQGYPPSPEQIAFLQFVDDPTAGSCLLEAVAGSGKTSSLILALPLMAGSVFLGAFNRDIAQELKARIPLNDQWRIQAATMHSAGLGAIKRSGRKPRTEPGKLRYILKDRVLAGADYNDPRNQAASQIVRLVSLAKQHGFDVTSHGAEYFPRSEDTASWTQLIDHFSIEDDLPENFSVQGLIQLSKALLRLSIETEAMIDFDDMLYLPLLLNYSFQPYDWVLLDEAQDTNVVRREMAFRMLKPGGRFCAVGDPHQAIYGFTGADANALDNIRRRARATTLPLSVSWRCARLIVDEARKVVSHIQAAPSAPEGHIDRVSYDEFFVDRLRAGDAVLCRLNRPNVATAIACLRANKPARIVGRDLGQRLLAHARKAAPDRPGLLDLEGAVEAYRTAEINRLTARSKESSIPFFEDEMDALSLLIERCLEQGKQGWADLEDLCNYLFINPDSASNAIIFSSVHKAKGLEWERVYLLGRSDYMPFFMATQEWELEQEQNLIYVAITRAKRELVYVSDVRSAIDSGVHRQQRQRECGAQDAAPAPAAFEPRGEAPAPALRSPPWTTEVALDTSILDAMLNPEEEA